MQRFVIPWPPGVNQMYRSFRGRTILSARARAWYEDAGAELLAQKLVPVSGPYEIDIELCAPTKRRYDPDGKVKAILDLLVRNSIIAGDDNTLNKRHTVVPIVGGITGATITLRKAPHEEPDLT